MQIRGLEQASENIQDGISVINVMDAALGTMQSPMLNRLRERIIQGANDTNTDPDRELIQKEITEIIEGIDDIVHNTEFNTIKPFIPPSEIIPGTLGGSGKADIVFVIDNTSSMGAQIQNVKNNIGNFVSALKAHNIDVNLGLVTYGDESKMTAPLNPSGDTVPSKSMGFPLDVDAFKNQVEHIEISNGGDGEESGLEGIMEAHKIPNFRPDATKNYILITDAPVHERLPYVDSDGNGTIDTTEELASHVYSKHTIDDVIATLDGEVKLTVITNGYANSQLEPLHSETNGLYLDINGMFGEQLLTLAEKITNESGGSFTEESMKPLIIHSDANSGQNIEIPLYDHRDFRLFLKDMALTPYESAMEALARVDAVIVKISDRRAEYGAISNRLEHAYNNVLNANENLTKAESQLRDTDIAKETIKLQKDQILLQASQSMMAQINQMGQGILQLLG